MHAASWSLGVSWPACHPVIAFSPSKTIELVNHKLFYWPHFDDPIISAQSRRTTRNESCINGDLVLIQPPIQWDNRKHGRDLSIILDTRFIPSVIRARKLLVYRPIALGKSRIILSPPWMSVFPRAFFCAHLNDICIKSNASGVLRKEASWLKAPKQSRNGEQGLEYGGRPNSEVVTIVDLTQ